MPRLIQKVEVGGGCGRKSLFMLFLMVSILFLTIYKLFHMLFKLVLMIYMLFLMIYMLFLTIHMLFLLIYIFFCPTFTPRQESWGLNFFPPVLFLVPGLVLGLV